MARKEVIDALHTWLPKHGEDLFGVTSSEIACYTPGYSAGMVVRCIDDYLGIERKDLARCNSEYERVAFKGCFGAKMWGYLIKSHDLYINIMARFSWPRETLESMVKPQFRLKDGRGVIHGGCEVIRLPLAKPVAKAVESSQVCVGKKAVNAPRLEHIARSKVGFVYILTNPMILGCVKVGMTTRSPFRRADEISSATGVPMPFVVAKYFEFPDAMGRERIFHEQHADLRLPGREFFRMSVEEAVESLMSGEKPLSVGGVI